MSFWQYWRERLKESAVKARVRTETILFVLFLFVGLLLLRWPSIPLDKTTWFVGFSAFVILFLVEVCFISPYNHAQRLHGQTDWLQKQLNTLLAARKDERADVVALRNLKLHHFDGLKIEAEIIGFPGRGATNAQWDEVDRWWRSAVHGLGQEVFSPFLPPGYLTSLDELEDDEAHGHTTCVRLTGKSDAAEERLCKCIRARLNRVRELIDKIEGNAEWEALNNRQGVTGESRPTENKAQIPLTGLRLRKECDKWIESGQRLRERLVEGGSEKEEIINEAREWLNGFERLAELNFSNPVADYDRLVYFRKFLMPETSELAQRSTQYQRAVGYCYGQLSILRNKIV